METIYHIHVSDPDEMLTFEEAVSRVSEIMDETEHEVGKSLMVIELIKLPDGQWVVRMV